MKEDGQWLLRMCDGKTVTEKILTVSRISDNRKADAPPAASTRAPRSSSIVESTIAR